MRRTHIDTLGGATAPVYRSGAAQVGREPLAISHSGTPERVNLSGISGQSLCEQLELSETFKLRRAEAAERRVQALMIAENVGPTSAE